MSRRRKTRRDVEAFGMSFLDVVSCGFGAIVLILVIVKISEPQIVEQRSVDLSGRVVQLQEELHNTRGETRILNRELKEKIQQLSVQRENLARLQGNLSAIQVQFTLANNEHATQFVIEAKLQSAKQALDAEMRRLQATAKPELKRTGLIGGVPVDSEYIIFIIDTSGSMQQYAWPKVLQKVEEVLRVYPTVKGIQVMNDMGEYMFSSYAGKWIPDSPARRRAINKRLAGWTPFSNSSPVEGIEAAIQRFYAQDKRISLYIFGDDFSHGSIEQVVNTVARLNQSKRGSGSHRVRIHAMGFPVLFAAGNMDANAVRFAALMRKLAERNYGSFVGLDRL